MMVAIGEDDQLGFRRVAVEVENQVRAGVRERRIVPLPRSGDLLWPG